MPKEEKPKEKSTVLKPYLIPTQMAQPAASSMAQPVSPAQPAAQTTQVTIPVTDLLKEASRIREYTGNNDYDLSSFIREVELFLPLFNGSPEVKNYIFQRNVVNKIQGPALQALRTLGAKPTWEQIKRELIRNFGVRETYHHLYHQATTTRNSSNVSEYFINLKYILDKLNAKYEFDESKPTEFSSRMNESIILRTFINGIDSNCANVIISRNITNLRDAYYTLEESGLIRQSVNRNFRSERAGKDKRNFPPRMQNYRDLHNFNQNRERNSGRYRQDHNQNLFRPGFNQNLVRQPEQNQNVYRQSGQFRTNYRSNSGQIRQNRPEPMEVDHLETNRTGQEEVNFQLPPSDLIYR